VSFPSRFVVLFMWDEADRQVLLWYVCYFNAGPVLILFPPSCVYSPFRHHFTLVETNLAYLRHPALPFPPTGAWAALLVFSAIAFRKERRRDPGFLPPSDGISFANVHDHIPPSRQAEGVDDPYADKHESSGAGPSGAVTGYESYGYARAPVVDEDNAFGRPSMDAYGAFDEDPRAHGRGSQGGGEETSRTMQLAYSDPCTSTVLPDIPLDPVMLNCSVGPILTARRAD
jgi:hypothetical protein